MRKTTASVFLLLAFATAALAATPAKSTKSAAKATPTQALHQLFDDEWEWQLRESPETATFLGDRRFDDRLDDRSPAAFERRRAHDRETLRRIEAIDRAKLPERDRLDYDLFLLQARNAVEGDAFPSEVTPVTQLGGVYSVLGELAQAIPRDTVKDHENFLARMRAFPRAVDDTIALMRRGLELGVTPPRAVAGKVEELIGNQLFDDPTQSPIYQIAFTNFRPSIPAAEQQRLQKEAATVLRNDVLPAIQRLHKFWADEYFPKTRESIALSSIPQGKEWYAYQIRTQTTTKLSADEIHNLGLSEVKRIRGEMEKVKEQAGFHGTLEEFFVFLRTDPRFYYTRREDLLEGYRDIAKKIDPELTRLFGRLPRLPYGVTPIPSYSEKTQTTAYYNPGAPESHRPGYYMVNLYDLASRPKWEMEALSLHESVPGHHLQIALEQELENVPKFRRAGAYTAFVEGWGLYAESLGPELGLFTDSYSKFGQLTYEMWRAVRLVVDTGMHSKGWTRQQAIDYFASNSSKPLHDIEVEIDRYIAWPGQALAYKIGELTIKRLRADAQRQLGEKFDIRAFHDELLGAGPLPMSLLETRMNDWIRAQKGSGEAKATITLSR
ncbi:MAG: DUF885 domain-containing protein [Acidobacteria bacterium]|nr:DUF885 domain-containing protein [Acidobacteriota bacterium]MBV9478023.1 DUF885 domain-containing protein [Acidobacteriota bacterium]